MKILYIDPWCFDGSNLYYYSTGLLEGLSSNGADITLVSGVNFTKPIDAKYKVKKSFFPYSSKMKQGLARTVIRGCEYIKTYFMILRLLKKTKYDVVHIEWTLLYSVDTFFLKKIKEKCKTLSLKAHNVLPHSTGTKYLETFRKIYAIPDVILLHGDNLKREFVEYYPEYSDKVKIQFHGIYMNHVCSYDEKKITNTIKKKIGNYQRIYLFFGRIDYDKGVDRLVKMWKQHFNDTNSLLVIAGKVDDAYPFNDTKEFIQSCNNVLFLEGFIEDNLLNFLITKSDLIILPYRDGSMSGVVFTAAEFSKPLLCTEFGAVNEYIINEKNSYIVENDDSLLIRKMKYIDASINNEELKRVGEQLNRHISDNYQWDVIGKKLLDDVYSN